MKHFSQVIVCGELHSYDDADHPQVRYMDNGDAVCNFNVLETQYDFHTGEPKQKDGKVSKKWHKCTAWREQAELAGRLSCGSTVIAVGKLTSRYDEKNSVWRDEIGGVKVFPVEGDTVSPAQNTMPNVSEIINLDEETDYI